jgi:hypothetical protein
MDARRSTAPFFREIEGELEGRALYTTIVDDRRLPLITWYLRRSVPALADRERAFELLRSEEPVGIVVSRKAYERERARFEAIPHDLHTAPSGKQTLAFVANAAD